MQTITKPSNGIMAVEVSDKEIELKFSTAEGRMTREENSLRFDFDDGSTVVLENFYTKYSKEEMPTFIVEGVQIPGSEFFAALGAENLMPAAGPEASQQVVQGGHSASYSTMALLEGLSRLGHLDIGFDGSREVTDTLHAEGVANDNDRGNEEEQIEPASELEPIPTLTPEPTPTPEPEPAPTPEPTPEPKPEPYTATVGLNIPSVFEGQPIIGKIALDNPPTEDCTIQVKIGDNIIDVPVPAGSTEVEFTTDNPNGEDPFIDASTIEAEIISIKGGGYDETTIEEPSTVGILDSIDEVKFSVAGEAVDETAETARFTVTSDDPVKTGSLEVVVNIGGVDYSIDMELVDGSWTGHVDVPVRENDLLINGKDAIKAYVVSASHDGHEWENPSYGSATEATVVDNVDDAVFNTTISVVDGQYIVEVTSAQPHSSDGHPSLTLAVNGAEQKIDLHWDEARELWTESVTYDVPAPGLDDETLHVEASISNPSMNGLEYENPILNPATKDIFIEHEHRDVQAQLDIPPVFEGSKITGTVILDIPPLEDCIITVKVGDTTIEVPVKANETEATFSIENPNGEDPFIDASNIEAEIVSINGGRYDDVELPEASTVNILDTIDEVKFSITEQNVDETAETTVFTITSDDPVQTGTLAVTVDVDGTEYTVPMEWTESGWSGTLEVPVRENDLLINGKDTMTAQVVSARHDSYEWENPNYGKATEATVVDNVDDAIFNTAISVADGQYIVEVTSAQPNSNEGHPTLTLSVNGESQQINLHWDDAREMWVESIAFELPAPTHSDETVHVEASISNPSMLGLEYENPICNPAVKDIVVEHEYWPVNASLDIPAVFEGSDIIGKIVFDNPPIEDCTATIKVGDTKIEVPIPAGSTEVEFTVDNPNGEDPFIDASLIEAEIISINGGGYDEINLDNPVNVDILDTIDEVKFTITGEHLNETAETATFTITSDDPVQTGTLTVVASIDGNEYPVQMEWTDNGWVGTINVPVRENDLLINGKDTIEAYVVSASHDGKLWENPNYGGKTEATIIDNVDDAVFNTSISVEDGQYVVEVTSSQPNSDDGHPSLTLVVNGESQKIDLHWDDARELWVESVSFDLPAPTHSDETVHVEASVSNPSMMGLEYENPILNPAAKDIVVEHEHWAVNAHLEIPSVFEGNEIAGRIILDNAPFEDCTAIVIVGNEMVEVPIPVNAIEVEFTVFNPNGEDPFIDASSIEAYIESINGGGYDEVNVDGPINVNILDTIDEVKFSITGDAVDETATTATFTITSDDPVQTGALTVVASIDGTEHSVAMELVDDSWIGHIEVPVRENDLLINGKDTIEAYIVSAKHDAYEWENPNYGGNTEATVIDNVDDAVFNTAISVVDGQYIVEVTSAQPYSADGNPSLTLTVNGESQQINLHWDEAREIWTESTAFDLPAPTHADETVHVEASISNPSMMGLEYENPILNPAAKDIVVEHEPWLVNAHLEIPSVFEGNEISGKVILDNAPFNDDCIALVKVGDATVEVPIPANATEASFTIDNPNTEDPFIDASSVQAEIVSINGGGYDSVSIEDSIEVSILDTIDEVKFSISGENVDETAETTFFTITSDDPVQTGALTVVASIDGKEYSVEMHLVGGTWTGQVEVPVRENDLLINGKDTINAFIISARHDSYEWENPNYGKATEATVIDNVDDAIFNTAISVANEQYIVEVTTAQPNSNEGHPALTLTVNGESQQINLHWDEARELWVESVSFDLPAPTHSDETVHVEASISDPSMLGLEYENPILNPATKDIVVEHEYWPVNAHLEVPSVFEGNEIAGKVILDNAPVDDCIVIVKVGDATVEVPVEAGNTEASFTIDNPNTEDPFIDASSVQAEIVSIDGGRYDEVNLEDPINVDIFDTIDKVTFSITGENVDETAETTIFTVTSDDPVQTGTLTVVASIDGKEYTVPMEWIEGAGWAGQVEVPVRENDLLINGKDTMEAYVVSAQHDAYEWENPDYGKATEATVIDNKDDAIFNTSITVNESTYVVEVTSAQPNSTEGHPTLTLTVNGESQQIDLHWDEARDLWVESVSFDLPSPGINDETLHVEASISDPSMKGLEYENPILNPAEKDIFIEHEPYNVTARLDIPPVFEGNDIVGAIILDNPPREDCTALVKVGGTLIEVPLPANASEVKFTVENPNTEDPFIDASDVQAQIMAINGGGYDARDLEEPITVNILDTIDEVKFAVSGIDVDENANKLVVNVTSNDPVATGSLVVQVQADGEDHFVTMHWSEKDGWTGKLELPVREDNVLIDGTDAVKVEIVNAVHDSHVWENPNYGKELELHVTDDKDAVTFNTGLSIVDGACIVNVSCDQKPDEGIINADLMLNGQPHPITLEWNDDAQSWTASMTIPLPSATVDGQPIHIEATVANPSMNGKEYENPLFNGSMLNVNVDAGKDSMAVDESYIPTGSRNPEDAGSDEASIYLGGSSTLFGHLNWSLEMLEQPDNLVALIDGLEREVELVKEEDARIVGRIHLNKSEDRDVFEIAIDDDGNATVKMLGEASLVHGNPAAADEAINLDGIRAVWTEGEESSWKDLHISFQDDAPWIGSTESHVVDPVNAGYAAEVRNLIDCGPGIDFTHGKSGARFVNDIDGLQFWAAEGVTLAPGIVQYAEDGWTPLEMIGIKDSLEGRSHWLQYSAHGSNNAKPWNWGLDVHSGARWEHGREISHDIIMHQGQAVIVDLDGKLAYGITVEFGACYDPNSTSMANDRQFPEAATIIFYRNGEMVGWETASGLSKGQDERTFGSAIADGFDKAVISVPDNHSIDPNPRNGYPEVSDNEWTIRKIDFTTHPQEQPIHASEGSLDIHASADGWMIGEKTISFWEDMIGDSINVTLEDGTKHLVAITYPSKASCIQGTLEDGSILFQGVIGADGRWTFGQYRDFSFEDSNTIPLWFKTGKDADGDWTGNSVDVQTNGFGDASVSIPLEVNIDSTNGVLPASSWWSVPVKVDIDEDHLNNGSWVQVDVGNGSSIASHTLQWNGDSFTTNDGFSFNWDGSELTWTEATPDVGKLLTVAVTQHWIDESGLDHEAFSFASAQRDVNGTPPPLTMQASAAPLVDDLANAKIASMMFADIPDSPSTIVLDATTSDSTSDPNIGSEMLYTQASSTELDAAMMTVTHSS